jgi:hypothetical protein
MRGRKPRSVELVRGDARLLQQLARSQTRPWFQVRRARIVLAAAGGARTRDLADRMQCDSATIWRTCRQYETAGLAGLLAYAPRSGRPERISPPRARADR